MNNQIYYKDNEWYDLQGKKVKGIKRFLKCISPDGLLKYLKETCNADVEQPYCDVVYNKCRYAVLYCIGAFGKKDRDLLFEISVATGLVNNCWHCWVMTSDYYIDLTAQQFDSNFPELTIIKRKANTYTMPYYHIKSYTVREWFDFEKNSQF